MSVTVIQSDNATGKRRYSAKRLASLPSQLVTPAIIAAAGGTVTKAGATLPVTGIRHLSATCTDLAADAKAGNIDPRMHLRHNSAALRRRTIPCPCCFAGFFGKATEKGAAYDAATHSVRRVKAAPVPAKATRKRGGK